MLASDPPTMRPSTPNDLNSCLSAAHMKSQETLDYRIKFHLKCL